MIRSNASKLIRELDGRSAKIYKEVGDKVAQAIWEAFTELVMTTPQYTGTTAASWHLSMGGKGWTSKSESVNTRKLSKGSAPHNKGHMEAVSHSIASNRGALAEISTKYRTADIVITNAAPGIETSQISGLLRAINQPGIDIKQFEATLSAALTKPLEIIS